MRPVPWSVTLAGAYRRWFVSCGRLKLGGQSRLYGGPLSTDGASKQLGRVWLGELTGLDVDGYGVRYAVERFGGVCLADLAVNPF